MVRLDAGERAEYIRFLESIHSPKGQSMYGIDYTGMDKTSLDTSSGSLFVTHSVHVTSKVITYHCSACRRRGTIERRLTLLRNT